MEQTPAKIGELVTALAAMDIKVEFSVDPGFDATCVTWLDIRLCGHEATVEYRPKDDAFGLYTSPRGDSDYGVGPDLVLTTVEETVKHLVEHFEKETKGE